MHRFLRTIKTLFSRRWLIPTIVVVLGMLLLARLGVWQLDRLEERRAENAELEAVLTASPLNLNADFAEDDLRKNREVVVDGVFDVDEQIVLLLQPWQGQAGVHLVTPLLFDGGTTAVLVDRGWVPESDYLTGNLSQYDPPESGQVVGYLTPSRPYMDADQRPDGPQSEWYRLDIEAIQPQLPYSVLPLYITQQPPADGNTEPPYQAEREVDLSEGSHLSYAIQWFLFSGLLAIIYIAYVSKKVP